MLAQGTFELLACVLAKTMPKWEPARVAAAVSLAGLALCPTHRESFLDNRSGVLDALAAYSTCLQLHRLTPSPRVAAAWQRHCGARPTASLPHRPTPHRPTAPDRA